ncbi:MAG: VOC family protein [Actinomycetes bacterium]
MTVRRVMHTAISTPDLDRAVEFWSHLGFVATREWSWPEGTAHVDGFLGLPASAARAALLEGPGGALELFEFVTPDHGSGTDRDHASSIARAGYTHLCLEVDGLDDEIDRLREVGMTFWADPVTDPGGRRMVYGKDPDGNVVELVEPPAAG